MTVRPVEGEFPPYRRLLPEAPADSWDTPVIGLNPRLVARFAKVVPAEDVDRRAKDRGNVPMRMTFVDELKPVVVRIGAGFTGLIMPVRLK